MNPESYAEFVDAFDNQMQLKKEPIEPWTLHPDADDATLIPLDVALSFVKNGRLKTIYNQEADYIHELAEDIQKNGLRTPLEMKVDNDGKICLVEGHHRMLAFQLINVVNVPIILTYDAKRVTGYGRQMNHYSEMIWAAIGHGRKSMLD